MNAVLQNARALLEAQAAAVSELANSLGDDFLAAVDLLARCSNRFVRA